MASSLLDITQLGWEGWLGGHTSADLLPAWCLLFRLESFDDEMSQTSRKTSAFLGIDVPDYDIISQCIHCGLCLPHCPTYALTGLEKSSPRGRIRLIKSIVDGDLPISKGFIDEMNFCLDCQACETACPAGVKYGALVEAGRAQIFTQGYESFLSKVAKRVILSWVFSSRMRLHFFAQLVKFYQRLSLHWLVEKTGLLKIFSKKLNTLQGLAPKISKKYSSKIFNEVIKPKETTRYRVGFLTGCIMDVAYADVNVDTVELLLRHDCEVVIPKGQLCCGSLQAHHGDRETARRLARHNIEVFEPEQLDAIIVNSAGCSAFMKEYGHVLEHEPQFADRAVAISAKVEDITEFLFEIKYRLSSNFIEKKNHSSLTGKRVTYHDACHLVHSQKISQQPRELIRSVLGIEFVELPESTWCCGSAGIYNIVRYDDSMRLLQRKIDNIKKVKPDIIVTGNPGCMAQIQYGLKREGLNVELLHTATFLRRACET